MSETQKCPTCGHDREVSGEETKHFVPLIKERSAQINLLEAYSKFLEERSYMDADWRFEEPYAIDEFLKERKNK